RSPRRRESWVVGRGSKRPSSRNSRPTTHDPRPTTHDPRPTTHDPRPTTHDPRPTMSQFFQPHLARMAGYQPGEQPRESGIVRLNTNENPYPPSPRVAEAIAGALGGALRKYPDPLGTAFREAAARHHGVGPDMVLAGHGS